MTGSEGIKDMNMRDRAWEAIPAALQASVEDGALAGLVTLAWQRGGGRPAEYRRLRQHRRRRADAA